MILWPQHPNEPQSNEARKQLSQVEPIAQRTYTPSLGIISKAAGSFVWTQEGRKLYDFTSGVLVANLGHHPKTWLQRVLKEMGWDQLEASPLLYPEMAPLTAYNAATPIEIRAAQELSHFIRQCPGGEHCDQILWAASGSEAIQKALWTALAARPGRSKIIATRFGFHGKKGLAGAVSGSESDSDRDPRVLFIPFPMPECCDVQCTLQQSFWEPLESALAELAHKQHGQMAALITEPYLGAAGSYHPPAWYLQRLQSFCREHDLVFILDEIQSNFGRTGHYFAFEAYGLQPDLVVLGKGLGNGIPVAAVAGPKQLMSALPFGAGSDTYSGHTLGCAAVIATLDAFRSSDLLAHVRNLNRMIGQGLAELRSLPFVKHIRGEKQGLVWGIEISAWQQQSANAMANACVEVCYRGEQSSGMGIHLLGPLAGNVLRIAPPYSLRIQEAQAACELILRLWRTLVNEPMGG